MENEMGPADIAAMMGGNNGFGGGSAWWIIILFLFAFSGNGFGFGGNSAAAATANDIQRAVDLNSIQQGQAGIANDIQRGIYQVSGTVKDAAYNNLGEIRDIQGATAAGFAAVQNALTQGFGNVQKCSCDTLRAIDGVNYNVAAQSAAIQANDAQNTQKILDALAQNRMAAMQNEINALQLQNAMCGVVRYPNASTYCAGSSIFNNGCGCNNI